MFPRGNKKRTYLLVLGALVIFGIGFWGGQLSFWKDLDVKGLVAGRFTKKESNEVAFIEDVYGVIQEKYWKKLSNDAISELFRRSAEKLTDESYQLESSDKEGVKELIRSLAKGKSSEEKKDLAVTLSKIVLANLEPFGRSRLYTKKEAVALGNRVNNVSKDSDFYSVLGVRKQASQQEIESAYQQSFRQLAKEKTPQAKESLKKVQTAYQTLRDENRRKLYDKFKVTPTVSYRKINPKIFYVHIRKFSPQTLQEFKLAADSVDQGQDLDTLILDLRNNVGGSIDALPKFLGPFIGLDRYAYQFFHRGEKVDYKTTLGWIPSLVRYKKVVVLVNEKTQSSAEVFASALKNYNVGVLVGMNTKGWGTVEKVFPLETKLGEEYYVFLAHSATLRADGKSIEGNGVSPLINVKSPGWSNRLYSYFHYPELILVVKKLISMEPGML